MEAKYSIEDTDYAHRFMIRCHMKDGSERVVTIYSDENGTAPDLQKRILEKNSQICSTELEHHATKEQDAASARLFDDIISGRI